MFFTIIYKDIKCCMNIPIEKLLSWNNGNTHLVDNNMWYDNITIYFGDKYPEEVQKLLKYYMH